MIPDSIIIPETTAEQQMCAKTADIHRMTHDFYNLRALACRRVLLVARRVALEAIPELHEVVFYFCNPNATGIKSSMFAKDQGVMSARGRPGQSGEIFYDLAVFSAEKSVTSQEKTIKS